MVITHLFASVPVADRDAAMAWYENFAGRPPDLIPNRQEAAWRMTDTGWIYIIEDAECAGSALNTLLVDDLDALLADLAGRGIEAGPVEVMGNGVRQAIVLDPEGNRLKIGQVSS
jgi:hypothetical protein